MSRKEARKQPGAPLGQPANVLREKSRVSPDLAARVNAIVARVGVRKTSVALGLSDTTLEALREEGTLTPAALQRATERIAKLEAELPPAPVGKACNGCGRTLPLADFYPLRASDPNGPRQSKCKACDNGARCKKLAAIRGGGSRVVAVRLPDGRVVLQRPTG